MSSFTQTNVVRGWAVFDLAITAMLATSFTAKLFIDTLYQLNGFTGGTTVVPYFAGIHWLFVCLAGVLGVLWALSRMLRPSRFCGLLDVCGRAAVAALIAYFIAEHGAPNILWAFVVTELVGAVHQFWRLR